MQRLLTLLGTEKDHVPRPSPSSFLWILLMQMTSRTNMYHLEGWIEGGVEMGLEGGVLYTPVGQAPAM